VGDNDGTSGGETTGTISREEERVIEWRLERFIRAGLAEADAAILALCPEIDVSEVEALNNAGCPSDLIPAILI